MHFKMPLNLFRQLVQNTLIEIEKQLDHPVAEITFEEWESYLKITKEIRDVMDEEMDEMIPFDEEHPMFLKYFHQWQELRDKANVLYRDILEDKILPVQTDYDIKGVPEF